jgi:hypothetical protein
MLMASSHHRGLTDQTTRSVPATNHLGFGISVLEWFNSVGRLFPRNRVIDSVATSIRLHASPETVWQQMLLYEEVPARPPLILRVALPSPLRTEGDKRRLRADVLCRYRRGFLVKQINGIVPPYLVQFDVTEQRLAIEGCVTAISGSYQICRIGQESSEITLVTNYQGHLRPRSLWRPLERVLVHQLHTHILNGMRASIAERTVQAPEPEQDSLCTTLPSHSQR